MNKIIKIIEKYLEIKIEKDSEEGFLKDLTNNETLHIDNYLWQLKSKKLQPWEKQTLKSYGSKHKVISNSVKRGSIGTTTRRKINKRDGQRCQYCKSNINPEIAHIVSRGAGGSGNDVNNLITLCRMHHRILDNPIGFVQNEKSLMIKEFIQKWKKSL